MHRTVSADDGYAGSADEPEGVPSCRRVTIPVARAKQLSLRGADTEAKQARTIATFKDGVRNEIERGELISAAVRSGDVVPDESMRRIKIARRVVGVPENICEQISEQCLRDPRRD